MDCIKFYQNTANQAIHPELKLFWELMIDHEIKHYDFFVLFERRSQHDEMPMFTGGDSDNVFPDLLNSMQQVNFSTQDIKSLEKTLVIERQTEKFYRGWVQDVYDETLKKQILIIADEEQKHMTFLDELMTHINQMNNVKEY